ncbi:endonuclease V [Winogradskyella sp.]|jgi:deoxyribonuclease V|uniref:endonuclease V n=1 Tax=Winogradskyella sp. TaxID=1883156 RepID=UPI0025CC978F|nr:endonuclease V [Winogradskyella sp.]MCT4629777.1 endonuclease V [Winogradskyella sp.]
MLLAIDVHYKSTYSKVIGVLFEWQDKSPQCIVTDVVNDVADYESGQFYKRELPCILQLIKQVDLSVIKAIIVDGHVYIDNNKSYGLGGHLWQALHQKVPVIGIAKKAFHNTEKVSTPIYRGQSQNPLYMSCIGMSEQEALNKIQLLHGAYRMPTILKILDQHTKSG